MTTGAAATALLVSAWGQSAHAVPSTTDPVGFGPASSSSWVASAVAGYNWQRGSVVLGFESDVSWMNLKSVTSGSLVSASSTTFVYPSELPARVDRCGTVRARLGWATGSFLFYGTGGLA
jgi:outer membrane immunogenic protein